MTEFETIKKDIQNFMEGSDLHFVTEKDFQIELAIALKEKGWEIICEYPYETSVEYQDNGNKVNRTGYIDIVAIGEYGKYPIELKYRTKKGDIKKAQKTITLKNHGAYDAGCYGFLRDICRIGEFVNSTEENSCDGVAIFLTNDKKYREKYSGKTDCERSYEHFWLGKHNDETYGPIIDCKDTGKTIGRVNGKPKRLDLIKNIENVDWDKWGEKGDYIYKIVAVNKDERKQ